MGIRRYWEVFTYSLMRIGCRVTKEPYLTQQEYLPSPLQGLELATRSRNKSARFLTYVSQSIFFETGGDRAGGYTNDPLDSGGETKWGISKRAHPHLTIKNLTYKQAVDIYKEQYYDDRYDYIKSEKLGFKLFDMGILTGRKQAIKTLQRAIVARGLIVAVDGRFGPLTLTAINNIMEDTLYEEYIRRLTSWFNKLVIRVRKNKRYLKGWLRRANWKWEI